MAATAFPRPSQNDSLPESGAKASISHPFTCNTCQVAFRSSDLQRTHMHSDWHRYNLKRRVISLPPLSSETFAEKVLTAQASTSEAAARASYERTCQPCQKTYYSENAYDNHLKSQKHKSRLLASSGSPVRRPEEEVASVMSSTFSLGEPLESASKTQSLDPEAEAEFHEVVSGIAQSSIQDEEPISRRPTRPHHSAAGEQVHHPLSPTTIPSESVSTASLGASETPLTSCLFCNYTSPTLSLNMTHMSRFHGMFIPEQQYLVDSEGLIRFLRQKVFGEHECLLCGQMKRTTSSIQTHMRDKGHCMIAFESEEEMVEVGQFYDFRSTYPDEMDSTSDDASTAAGGVRLSSSATGQESLEDADAEGWETDSSASSLDSEDLTSVAIDHRHHYRNLDKHPHHSHHDMRHHSKDGYHSHAHTPPHAVFFSDHELHLPSGRSVGHRSLARYYRQNLRDHPLPSRTNHQRTITDVNPHGREDRGRDVATRQDLSLAGVTVEKKREVAAIEKRDRRQAERAQRDYQWGVNKRANMQKHFRASNIGLLMDPLLQ
ncbi:MAG: hypothetical protein M1817_003108 [Caeruleum heppii]|nr:MAG: hypothetical protein M1817_003108 [Caeruleum heppii]